MDTKINKINYDAWKNTHKKGSYTEYPSSDAIGFFKKIKNKKNYKILELGCASGNMQVFFRKEGFKSYGLDFSIDAIKNAKKNLKKNKLKTNNLICRDMRNLADLKKFNCIFDYNSMSCTDLESIKKTLEEVKKIMKPTSDKHKVNSLEKYHNIKNPPSIFITNLYSRNTKIKGGKFLNNNTYMLSAGKVKNYSMTLFNLKEAKKILKDFKIICYETHGIKIHKNNYNFEKFTFYCI